MMDENNNAGHFYGLHEIIRSKPMSEWEEDKEMFGPVGAVVLRAVTSICATIFFLLTVPLVVFLLAVLISLVGLVL